MRNCFIVLACLALATAQTSGNADNTKDTINGKSVVFKCTEVDYSTTQCVSEVTCVDKGVSLTADEVMKRTPGIKCDFEFGTTKNYQCSSLGDTTFLECQKLADTLYKVMDDGGCNSRKSPACKAESKESA